MDIVYKTIGKEEMENVLTLWNENIGVMFPLDKRLLKQNAFNKYYKNVIYGAYFQNKLIGMICYKKTKDRLSIGYISFLIVDVAFQRNGIGSKLVAKAEESLQENRVRLIHLGSDPYHFFPGIPLNFKSARTFFQRHGYIEETQSFDLKCDLSKLNLQRMITVKSLEIVQEDRYSIEFFQKEDFISLKRFFEKNFPGRWYEETVELIEQTGQYKDLIILKDNELKTIIGFCRIYTKESGIIGPSVYWRKLLGDSYGGLGPIGIDADYRKKGLGLTFLYHSLEILQKRNVKNTCIDWTVLIDFYGTFNFLPWMTYIHTNKKIN